MKSRTDRNISPILNFWELYTPKIVTIFREGYQWRNLQSDVIAGLTVAIVALPLSMAIAIASGLSPASGLYTAILGGAMVSLLGGSRFQIGGPAGAFIVIVAQTVNTYGVDGLVLATIMSGILLFFAGLLRLGTYVKFIPYPVTIGFTSGIAIIIFASQLKELFGLQLVSPEPGALLEKLQVLWNSSRTFSYYAIALSVATIFTIQTIKKYRPHWPGMLIAVAISAFAATLLDFPVSTIGSAFGGIPSSLPRIITPIVSIERITELLPTALTFTLLGSIESLLSAVVADGMTGRRHRSNCELVGQGVANLASGLFGGFCVTGTIARTVTNIRAGAHGPVSGIVHALVLLLFILIAAPLASYIPLSCLAGVLVIVSWNMIEKTAVATLMRSSRDDAIIFLTTFLLTVFRDLSEAIIIGVALGALLFIHRMSESLEIKTEHAYTLEDQADDPLASRSPYDERSEVDPYVVVYRISGAFFFGTAGSIGSILDNIADTYNVLILDLGAVPFVDSTAANLILTMIQNCQKRDITVFISGTSVEIQNTLEVHHVHTPLVTFAGSVEMALEINRSLEKSSKVEASNAKLKL